jgi:hypothetical protein
METYRPGTAERLLVSGGHAPHIQKMTPRENPKADASHHPAAIARWDDEGGAATSFADKIDAKVSSGRPKWRVEEPASRNVDEAFAEEEKILEYLGAAVIMRWDTLPTKIQRDLFEHATSLADLTQTAPLKERIARFLHNRKDNGFRMKTMTPKALLCACIKGN